MIILGIETSCDETAVALVEQQGEAQGDILSHRVFSQLKDHNPYGGVVPEIAARVHIKHLDGMIKDVMADAGLKFSDLDGVAATTGPGLIGGVMVGMMMGKSIAAAYDLPFLSINHLEAHALMPRLTDEAQFPYLLLLASGGHTQLLIAQDVGAYDLVGETKDDALGECFDKSAKMLGLPYPGGPQLEKLALECSNPVRALEKFPFPKPFYKQKHCDFSFSGLKSAVRQAIEKIEGDEISRETAAMIASSFQQTVCDVLEDRCTRAIHLFQERYPDQKNAPFIVSGGVAANKAIRTCLENISEKHNMRFLAPPLELCSDNGVMIAWAGIEYFKKGIVSSLDVAARPRWPLKDM